MQFRVEYENPWTDPGTFFRMPVGDWRYVRPVVNKARCNMCAQCYFFCPTGCIEDKGDHFAANLDYCKGCGICAKECSLDAITMVPEAEMVEEVE